MATRRVFFLASGQLTAYPWRGGRLRDPVTFVADETGLTEFAVYLDAEPLDPVYVIVDVVEEEFREETVPHVFGADRRALLRTKSNRLFRDARYTHALMQGRESTGRRDDRVLFSALIRSDLLAPWLGQIARHKVPLAGVYSLALLGGRLLERLKVQGENVLLVTLQSSGGLRQTFLQNGQLKLSRLAVMPYLEPGQFASYILAEVEKIRRYLNSLRLVARDGPLEVLVLSHGEMLRDLERQASDSVATTHRFVEVADVARSLGLKRDPPTPYADRVFAQLVARYAPANHYASPEETRYHAMYRARAAMKVASALLVLGSLVFGGLRFAEGIIQSGQTKAIGDQTSFYADRYQRARGNLPKTPAEPRELRLVVETAGFLAARRTSPLDMMKVVSNGLVGYPTLRIDSLAWKVSSNPEAPVGGRPSRPRTEGVTTAAPAPEPAGEPGRLFELALVSGRVDPFNGNYRDAIAKINGFADALTAQPSIEHVRVLSLPLELGSNETLSGQTDRAAKPAEFAVRVALRLDVPRSVKQ